MTNYQKSLYKKDSKDKIRVFTVIAEDHNLMQISGLLNGKQVKHSSLSKPKNIGKSNETTAEEQAVLEAESLVTKKLKEGYFETEEKAKSSRVILPMLAKSFEKKAYKIDWKNAFVQPKLDGMRCLKNSDTMISRKNKIIDTLPHINKEVSFIVNWLDGELYAHGLSFQENMKLIKKQREESINVKYHVYDIVLPDMPFTSRYIILEKMLRGNRFKHLKLVPTYQVTSIADVKNYHAKFLEEGYEGTMIRWGEEGYKINGRSDNLLKYKNFIDLACIIVDVKPSDKNPKQGVIECEAYKPDGSGEKVTFGCGMKFSHEKRKEILLNKHDYIGKTAEIRFFEFSDDGIPRFPVCVGFRLDK